MKRRFTKHTLAVAVLAAQLVPGVAPGLAPSLAAQSLTVSGVCPGPVTLDLAGATPNGDVALYTADGPGSETLSEGPCAGTELEIAGNVTQRRAFQADGNGGLQIQATAPDALCGTWLQAVDLATCEASNSDLLNFPPPTEIDISCSNTGNPLRFACTVTVDPPQPVEVRYGRSDLVGIERANRSTEALGTHSLPIFFMAPEREYLMEARALGHLDGPVASATLATGQPPFDVRSGFVIQGESTMGLMGGELPCDGAAIAVIYDTSTGELVWYQDLDSAGNLGVLDMVRYTEQRTIVGETDGKIVQVDLGGQKMTEFEVDYPGCCSLHHDVFEKDDIFYSLYQDTIFGLTLDPVVMLDSEGNELYEWDPREHLPVPGDAFGDWLHANTVWVEEDGTALMSWLTRDSVAKIDLNPTSPTFGDVLWVMDGNPPDSLPSDVLIDWSNIGGANFFSDQHNFSRRHDGRYMLLDNANGRGLVFSIDEENRIATVDAQYETAEFACGAQGTATDTEAGNALVGCNQETVREYDGVTNQLLWEAEIQCENGGGGFLGTGSARWYSLDGWSKDYLPTPSR